MLPLTDNEKAKRRQDNKRARIDNLRDRYWQATGEDLPSLANDRNWPSAEPSFFQRIVLDNTVKTVWYDKIKEPAIMNMSEAQLRKATYLAEDIVTGARPLELLNERSLEWREERKAKKFRRWS